MNMQLTESSFANRLTKAIIWLLLLCLPACNVLIEKEPVLRIGTNIWPGYEPLYLARKLDMYDGHPIRLVEFSSASDVMEAMRDGSLEAAALTLDEALTLMQDRLDIKIVLVMDFSDGGDALLVTPGIDDLSQLRGKKVVVENTAVGAVLLEGVLQAAGLKVTDISIVSCKANRHIQCYQTADAVVTYEPYKSKLQQTGAKILFDSSRIPQRIVDVLVVNTSAMKASPKAVSKTVEAWLQARDYYTEHPETAAGMMAPRMGLSQSDAQQAFAGVSLPGLEQNRRLLAKTSAGLIPVAERLNRLMLDQKLLLRSVDVQHIIDDAYLPVSAP